MKTFLHTPPAHTVDTSRRRFIVGNAAVAGSGLALGLPATRTASTDAHGLTTPGPIKLTTFSKEDIALIRYCWQAQEQSVYDHWSSLGHRREFDTWLRTTPINADLAPHLWGLFGAHDPIRMGGWDFHDGTHRLEGRSGLVFSVTVDKGHNAVSLSAMRDPLKAFIDLAKRSGAIHAANTVLTFTGCLDGELEKWLDLNDYVHERLMPKEVEGLSTILNAAADEPHSVCLWLAV